MSTDVSRALADLARAFDALGRRWYVFGAQAVAAAGVPRFTADIDVTVEATPRELNALLSALATRGFTPRDVGGLRAFVTATRVVPVAHRSGFPVDVVLAGPGLEEEMLARARTRRIGRLQIPFIDTADLVVLKVLAGRGKDLEDVRALLRVGPPELRASVARARLATLAAVLEDVRLLETFDALVAETATARPTAKKKNEVRTASKRSPRKR